MNVFTVYEFDPLNSAMKCTIYSTQANALNYVLTGYKDWMQIQRSEKENNTFRLIFRKDNQIKRVSIFKKTI